MTKTTTRDICLTGMFMALIFAVTRFIQIPIPLGYFNCGNAVILCACILLPPAHGILAGSLGSALADLLSFPIYTVPTLLIKALMPMVYYMICGKVAGFKKRLFAAAIATLIPLFGYTLTGMLIAGSVYAGFAQFPGLCLEYGANLILIAIFQGSVLNLRKILH